MMTTDFIMSAPGIVDLPGLGSGDVSSGSADHSLKYFCAAPDMIPMFLSLQPTRELARIFSRNFHDGKAFSQDRKTHTEMRNDAHRGMDAKGVATNRAGIARLSRRQGTGMFQQTMLAPAGNMFQDGMSFSHDGKKVKEVCTDAHGGMETNMVEESQAWMRPCSRQSGSRKFRQSMPIRVLLSRTMQVQGFSPAPAFFSDVTS